MYKDSCGQTLNQLVHGILAATLLILWGNIPPVQDSWALSLVCNSASAVEPPAEASSSSSFAVYHRSSANAKASRVAPTPAVSRLCNPVVVQPAAGLTSSQCYRLADQFS